ncbi:MAG: VanZ family protein [Lachnospiraceae bacterium]|nr:VanZ family protein [Lachnospiraceae bacterium]
MLSFVTSLTIEVLQLFMKKGLFEFDDIFHNTLGGVLGYVIYLCGSISIYGIKTYINLLRKKADSIIC